MGKIPDSLTRRAILRKAAVCLVPFPQSTPNSVECDTPNSEFKIPNSELQIHHSAFSIPIPKVSCDNAQKLKIRVGHYGEIGFGLGNGQNCSEAAG